MKKAVSFCLVFLLALTLVGCSKDKNYGKQIFDAENIEQVWFFTPNAPDGLLVPEEDMDEIALWVGTFTVGEKAKQPYPPGTNSIKIRIDFRDGEVYHGGMSTYTIADKTYDIEHGDTPQCYLDLIHGKN